MWYSNCTVVQCTLLSYDLFELNAWPVGGVCSVDDGAEGGHERGHEEHREPRVREQHQSGCDRTARDARARGERVR